MDKTVVLENTARRDTLIAIEKKYQKVWEEEKVFQVNAPNFDEVPFEASYDELHAKHPKHFSSMAYPYMNGVLHAGHSFTLSKVEFATGFERMNGKRALFPLGFHCTGMPILASADKLKRELEQFGADFSKAPSYEEEEAPVKQEVVKEDPTKFKAKKSKVQAKAGRAKYQFEIMEQLGIPKEEVPKFADPTHWLYYFPALTEQDVTRFGSRVDWRRSMITTDVNPYYDSFVRWQMNKLRELGKIKFGKRYTIYSEKDGQPCMDHDRSSGEGLGCQEYVGIKIEIVELPEMAQSHFADSKFDWKSKKIFLVAATLRPETMYGQTCCFVSPKIDYGVFHAGGDEYYVCTERAFKNMSFQGLTPKRGDYSAAVSVNGALLVGSKIDAPTAVLKNLRVLPMETVLADKGTGVVTCVPSDSPDDYVTTRDLRNKPEYYGIEKEWVQEEVVPIIKTEKYGDKCAEFLCNELKIQSPKDAVQLAKAKESAYKAGFYNGVMIAGPYAGEAVETAKPKVKEDMVRAKQAFVYNEPEGRVVSRSNDECIVSLEDQWYLDYGEPSWKAEAMECLMGMNTFTTETKNAFEGVLDWLKNWAVSRTYGLGSRIPWDPKYLVESLSDSTVYHAFYTVAHLLHSDYYGQVKGELDISADQMTDQVWDYVFSRSNSVDSDISDASLKRMRREFEYFYPMDVSISGKDLIPNHLSFFIYTNVALFPKHLWPGGIRANGHLMLNNAKMSKSTGNFMTLKQITEKYGADASRIAIADAGDTIEDANFEEASANAAILRLFVLKGWAEEMVKSDLRTGPIESFFDVAFDNEMNALIEQTYTAYEATNYKAALVSGLFDFQTARDYYRECSETLHKDLVLKYIESQALMLAPIAPHFAEYIYREVLGKTQSVQNTPFPRADKPVNRKYTDALAYVRDLARSIRTTEGALMKKKKGKVDLSAGPAKLTIYVAETFPDWQEKYIEMVREAFESQTLNDNNALKAKLGSDMKRAMPFISLLKQRLAKESPETVFNRELSFDETETVKAVVGLLQRAPSNVEVVDIEVIGFKNGEKSGVNIVTGETVEITATGKAVESAVPGEPGITIKNV